MRKADNLPPSCAVDTKSGNLNFLEPSGSLRACNGTAYSVQYNENSCDSGTCSAACSSNADFITFAFSRLEVHFVMSQETRSSKRAAYTFRRCRSHIKNSRRQKVTQSKFPAEDTQTSGATG